MILKTIYSSISNDCVLHLTLQGPQLGTRYWTVALHDTTFHWDNPSAQHIALDTSFALVLINPGAEQVCDTAPSTAASCH